MIGYDDDDDDDDDGDGEGDADVYDDNEIKRMNDDGKTKVLSVGAQ